MKMKNLKSILFVGALVLFLISSCKQPKSHGLPESWFVAGSQPKCYKMGTDSSITKSGDYSAIIKSLDNKIDGFGTLMQQCLPGKFIGKRIRMSGYIKSKNVTEWAGLWVRVDVDTVPVSFDNMHDGTDRSVKGTTDWKRYEIVLDVPTNATAISYGALLCGTGQIWFDNLTFEIVDKAVKTTGISRKCTIQNGKAFQRLINEPSNLDFEK
jgi:hypothetical protein